MNLLPEENKIAYKKFYLKRLFVVFGVSVFLVLISGIVILTSVLLLVSFNKKELISEVEYFSKKDTSLADNMIVAEIKKLNDRAESVELSKKNLSPSQIFKKIIDEKSNNIKIISISYEKKINIADAKTDAKDDLKKEDKITLSGIAQKRDDLIIFEKRLKEQFGDSKVVSPVSNLINGKNLDFSISLYVKN